jgi:acylphosphatase
MLKSGVAGTVGLDAQGQIEAFAIGADGALWQIQQIRTPTSLGWSSWQTLGSPPGLTLGVPPGSAPVVAANGDGRLEVFVTGSDGAVWHIWQINTTGGGWSGWQSLGGSIASLPAVGKNWDGRLEVFAWGTDGALWHVWQNLPALNWSGWASFGGTCTSFPVVGLNRGGPLNNCLEVLVIGNDFPAHHMYHLWQLTPGGGWSGWTSLGGYISPDPSLGQNQDGRLEVFAIGNDVISGSNSTHDWQNTAGTTQWSGFNSLGNPPPGTVSPQVTQNQDGRLEVFGGGQDGALWHIWQTSPNNGWSGWGSLGVPGPGTTVLFAIGNNQDGRIEVFSVGSDGALWHIWQTNPNNGWSGWASLGHP